MFELFNYDLVDLKSIRLDERNPRIVTQSTLTSQDQIIKYFFDHENLSSFIVKIATEGRNRGAERPYVIKDKSKYVVIEGNTRVAAYKLLSGQSKPPAEYSSSVPQVSEALKSSLTKIEVSVAPSRDAMLPLMASAHFGLGDKSRWGYLGSRKAVYDEWRSGKSLDQLSLVFRRPKSDLVDYILEYKMYLDALSLPWSTAEKDKLLSPAVEFNPPVRFLQSAGHREQVGVIFDRVNLEFGFSDALAKSRYRHLIWRLVVEPKKGLGATSTFGEVFSDFSPSHTAGQSAGATSGSSGNPQASSGNPQAGSSTGNTGGQAGGTQASGSKPKTGALFNYPSSSGNLVVKKLMSEAAKLNCYTYPASGTALLRSLLEAILKTIIHDQSANPQGKMLSLESSIDICLGQNVSLPFDDKKIIKDFKSNHLDYLNMGVHATQIPNALRLFSVRDCVDQLVKRNA